MCTVFKYVLDTTHIYSYYRQPQFINRQIAKRLNVAATKKNLTYYIIQVHVTVILQLSLWL